MDDFLFTGVKQEYKNKLSVETFLEKKNSGNPVVDVRSPAEYTKGHIPGAVNMPLFSDEERSIVGTLYTRSGKDDAIAKGIEIIGPKLKDFAKQGLALAENHEIIVYCWRGGMRSSSLAWLFETIGLKASTLTGGYKTYRRYIHEYLSYPFAFIVIGGMTGCGKTEILIELNRLGYPVVNLEKLASHKGSVFGAIGEPAQPTTEQFENFLFEEISLLDKNKPIFIEDESLSIGPVFLPKPFHRQMLTCTLINILASYEERVNRLVNLYAFADKEILIRALKRIEKRVGTEETNKAIDHIRQENFHEAVSIILKYYDKVYTLTMKKQHSEKKTIDIELNNNSVTENAQQMNTFLTLKRLL
jgi:tRNA 2-selenouridine synthase